jgi:hypothetical protein
MVKVEKRLDFGCSASGKAVAERQSGGRTLVHRLTYYY